MRSIKAPAVVIIAVIAAAAGFAVGQGDRSGVRMVQLPLPLPAVGNVDAVRQWRFARIEEIQRNPANADIGIRLRLANGETVNVFGPRQPLAELGRSCGWMSNQTQTVAGRPDYVERLIAFDAEDDGRIIAVISMEPFNRSRARLRRVFSTGN